MTARSRRDPLSFSCFLLCRRLSTRVQKAFHSLKVPPLSLLLLLLATGYSFLLSFPRCLFFPSGFFYYRIF